METFTDFSNQTPEFTTTQKALEGTVFKDYQIISSLADPSTGVVDSVIVMAPDEIFFYFLLFKHNTIVDSRSNGNSLFLALDVAEAWRNEPTWSEVFNQEQIAELLLVFSSMYVNIVNSPALLQGVSDVFTQRVKDILFSKQQ